MSNFMLKSMVRGFLPMLPEALGQLDAVIARLIAETPLEENEVRCTYLLLIGQDKRAYITTAFLDENDRIVRTENAKLATEFLQTIISESL
jgi:hypothetical protein